MKKDLPQRKHIRLRNYDYSLNGGYFITICTQNKRCVLSSIVGRGRAPAAEECAVGRGLAPAEQEYIIEYTECGKIAEEQLHLLEKRYGGLTIDRYVIMPNHIHAIIHIEDSSEKDLQKDLQFSQLPNHRMALGVVVGGFKRDVTLYAKRNYIQFGWQGRYHDHVIRGARDGNRIVDYIKTNVMRWDNDCFFDE